MEKMHKRILITIIIGVILIAGFYAITNAITKYTGFFVSEVENEEDDFGVCLKEQDIALYVNTEDISSTLNNIELIDELQYINVKNCLRDKGYCEEKGVVYFPTWIINNIKINKDISFDELSEYSGCRLIRE